MLAIKNSKLRTLLALGMSTCLYHYEDCNGPGPSARLTGLKSTSQFSRAVLSGFSVEASNRRIPPSVKTKVAACAGNEICLCLPFF